METTIQAKINCPVCRGATRHCYTKDGFGVARCSNCKTLFIEDPPADTSAIYDEGYFFGGEQTGGYGSYDAEKEMMRNTFEHCLDLISTYRSGDALFDVGAATGYFLALAKNRGFNVSGIDISSTAAEKAKKKGITVEVGTLETVSHTPSSYDVVTMFDVLEHVPHPNTLIQQTAYLLPAGGILMGSTPDSGSLYARLLGKHWHMLFPPEHLVLLNDYSIRLLLLQNGFETIWTGRITKRFSLPYILQTAARWLHIPLLSRIGSALRATWLGKLAIPLDLRDNLFFLARKKEQVAIY